MDFGNQACAPLKNVKLVVSLPLIFMLAACAAPQQVPIAQTEPAPPMKTAPTPVEPDNRAWVAQLLYEAEQAALRARWINPAHDNARLYYDKVLEVEPSNQQALAGLASVADGLAGEARRRIAAGDVSGAQQFIDALERLDASHPDLPALTASRPRVEPEALGGVAVEAIDKAAPVAADSVTEGGPPIDSITNADQMVGDTVMLSQDGVSARNRQTRHMLAQLAALAKSWDSRMTIIARNDAEGRWIYQQMREAISDYRLRASLEIGRQPRIVFLDKPDAN